MPESFGFVGLGNIGGPMAERLAASGQPTYVFDVSAAARDRLSERGARVVRSSAEVAASADLVDVCVRDVGEIYGLPVA